MCKNQAPCLLEPCCQATFGLYPFLGATPGRCGHIHMSTNTNQITEVHFQQSESQENHWQCLLMVIYYFHEGHIIKLSVSLICYWMRYRREICYKMTQSQFHHCPRGKPFFILLYFLIGSHLLGIWCRVSESRLTPHGDNNTNHNHLHLLLPCYAPSSVLIELLFPIILSANLTVGKDFTWQQSWKTLNYFSWWNK